MDKKWHTIKVRVTDETWLHWRLSLLAQGVTADALVSAYVERYVKRNNPMIKSGQAHPRARTAKHQRGNR